MLARGLRGQTLDALAVQQRRSAAVFDVGSAGAAAVLTEERTLWRTHTLTVRSESHDFIVIVIFITHRAGVAADLHAAQLEPGPVGVQLRRPAETQTNQCRHVT